MEKISFCLLWGVLFGIQMLLISYNIFVFNKTKRMEIFKAFISVFILYAILLYCDSSDIYFVKLILASVFEMGILFFLLIAFTKSKNLMVDALIYTVMVWICNIFWYVFCLIAPEFMIVASFDGYSSDNFLLQISGGVIVLIITYFVMLLYKKFVAGRLEFFYSNKLFAFVFPVIMIVNEVRYMLKLKFSENYMAFIIFLTILLWTMVIVLMVYLYNLLKKRRIKRENREAALILDNIYANYEEMVKENNELKNIKHDLNKQLDFIKELSATEDDGAARQYLLELVSEKLGSLTIPVSGNIDIDTILAMFQRKASKLSICFEEVIEPNCDMKLEAIELIGLLTVLLDDAFFKCTKDVSKPWIRISIRARGKNTMIKLEYSRHKKHYAVRSLISSVLIYTPTALKNDFLLKRISEKYAATYIYEEDEEKNTLAVVM